jgi:hypothetical protein
MRIAISFVLLVGLTACTTTAHYPKSEYAEIATEIVSGCELPSARFRALRDEQGRPIKLDQLAVRVRPGVYDIGLSCGVTFDREHLVCIAPEGNIAEQDIPVYKLTIRPRVRYLFGCLQENGVWTYHMVESAL